MAQSRICTMNRTATGPRSQRRPSGAAARSAFALQESNGFHDTRCDGDVLRTGTVRGPVRM